MNIQIAIITTEYLRDFVNNAFADMQLEMEYTIYTYVDFDELVPIYCSLPDHVQAVITSGLFPCEIIRKAFPDTHRIIDHFTMDDAALYRLFFQLLDENRGLDISRIYADVFNVVGINSREYLFGERKLSYGEIAEAVLRKMPLDELLAAEKVYMNKHLSLWKSGRVDISVTRFSSIAQRLAEEGLRVYFPYPTYEYLHTICMKIIQEVQIHELQSNQSASIAVYSMPEDGQSIQEASERVYRAMGRFNTMYQMGAVLQTIPQGCELLTKRSIIEKLTEQFTFCRIRGYLEKYGINSCYVGYGLGTDLSHARINAIDAVGEARRIAGGASSLINERNQLICPLRKEQPLVISRDEPEGVRWAAQQSGLSTITIQKVITAVKSTPDATITSQELAFLLSVTKRSANRFLSTLKKAGFAKIVGQKKDNTMGRPERIYTVEIDGQADCRQC